MNHPDFDRAFPKTPDCIHSAIEMGIRKGEKKMKMQRKIISMVSAAAGLLIVIAVAALAGGAFTPTPTPDVLAQPPANDVRLYTPIPSGAPTVWYTEKGTYYHSEEHCSDMQGADSHTLPEAQALGKQPCPVCVPDEAQATVTPLPTYTPVPGQQAAEAMVYGADGGVYYHAYSDCSGMRLSARYPLTEMWAAQKKPCPACITPIHVFSPEKASYYHSDRYCSGMQDASAMYAEEAHALGKQPCPACILQRDVFYAENGRYYHAAPECMNDSYSQSDRLLQSIAAGRMPCAECMGQDVTNEDLNAELREIPEAAGASDGQILFMASYPEYENPSATPTPLPADRINTMLYITEEGIYAHQDSACCGISGARECTYEEARALGRISCPVCGSNPRERVYATENGKYYHCTENCSGMLRALSTTPTEAQWAGKHACPVCIMPAVYDVEMKGEIPNQDWLQRFMPNTNNGIWLNDMVYTAAGENKFHRNAACPSAPEEQETLELALARNQYPCPQCIGDLRKDNNLFLTAFGPTAARLWDGWSYSHCYIQDYKNGVQDWIFTDSTGTKTTVGCTVYRDPRGTGAEEERQLDVLFISAKDSRRFLESVTVEPVSCMVPVAMEMAEEHLKETGQYTGDEDHHVSDLTLLFDENRQITSCIMYFRQPEEPFAVSLEITEAGIDAQIESID